MLRKAFLAVSVVLTAIESISDFVGRQALKIPSCSVALPEAEAEILREGEAS